jgi:hypothetical protein
MHGCDHGGDRSGEARRAAMRQCSGMPPEEVTLDLTGTDEFSLACQSLPRTDP